MLNKTKKYTINISQLAGDDNELVGIKAKQIKELERVQIPIPAGFVVTTTAFDDFLIANNLVEFIGSRINNIDYSKPNIANKVSAEIIKAINNARFPDILSQPLTQSYASISAGSDSLMLLQQSAIAKELDSDQFSPSKAKVERIGIDNIMLGLKEIWGQLFSPEALQYRAKIDYEGYLTQAVIIQKVVQSEVSGRVYTYYPYDNNPELLEIEAIFGLDNGHQTIEIVPDSYIVNKNSEELVEKRIVEQTWMLVRKGRVDKKDPFLKVNISPAWKKKQKLDDRQIISLAKIAKTSEQLLKKPLELTYSLEAGKLYLYEIKSINNVALEKKIRVRVEQLEEKQAVEAPQKPQQIAADEPTPPTSQATPEAPEKTDVEVTLQPLEELSKVLAGEGNKVDSLAFGLVHILENNIDVSKISEDEIIVTNNVDLDLLKSMPVVRGIILSGLPDTQLVKKITVPVIYNVENAERVLKEGEVVTMDAISGDIFLGAGKREQSNVQMEEENTEISLSSDLDKQIAEEQPEPQEESAQETTEIEENLFDDFTEKHNEAAAIKTNSFFYQIFDPKKPELDLNVVNGLYVDMADFYLTSGFHPDYIINDAKIKRMFLESIVRQIKPILSKLNGKPMILESSNLNIKQASKLTGYKDQGIGYYNLSGASRLLESSKLLEFELEIISVLRNRESMKNLWYAFPDIRTEKEQAELKKSITSFGFRRSSTFKLYSVIDTVLGAIEIKELVNNGIDGIIINFDEIIKDLFKSDEAEVDRSVVNFLSWVIWSIHTNNTSVFLMNHMAEIEKESVKDFIEKGLVNFIMPYDDIIVSKPLIAELEIKKLEKKKKRGRKKKKIDYGF